MQKSTPRKSEPPAQRKTESPSSSFKPILAFAAVVVVAFLVRLAYVLEIRDSALFTTLFIDARAYDLWGQAIAAGDWLGTEVFYQAPLYPYFLGVVYSLFGHDLFALRMLQAALGACSCLLLALATRNFFTRRAGLLAGCLLALYPAAIFFDGLVQKAVLGLFLTCLLLYVLSRLWRDTGRMSRGALFSCGAVLGAFSLTRENALILYFVIGMWLFFANKAPAWRRRWIRLGLFSAGLAVVLVPVCLRNLAVGGQAFLTTSQFGSNFYIGNNPRATGVYVPLRGGRGSPEFERTDATELAEAALGQTLTPREVSAYWLGKSFAYIRNHPGHWLRLMARKWVLVWNAIELSDAEDMGSYERESFLLRVLGAVFHFGILCPLGLLGLCITWRPSRYWLLYGILLAVAASVTAFFVFARYRFPLIPLCVLFAAGGLSELVSGWSAHENRQRLLLCLVPTVVVAVFSNWPVMSEARLSAVTDMNLGNTLMEQDHPAAALRHYSRAVNVLQGSAAALSNMGSALRQLGRIEEAVEYYSQALRIQGNYPGLDYILGRSHEDLGHPDAAARHYSAAISDLTRRTDAHLALARLERKAGRLDSAANHYEAVVRVGSPEAGAQAHYELGALLAAAGHVQTALAHYSAALAVTPHDSGLRNRLGMLLASTGRFQAAAVHFSAVTRAAPRNHLAHSGLGGVLFKQGKMGAALFHLSEAVRIKPDYSDAHHNLGVAHANARRWQEALAHFSRTLRIQPDSRRAHLALARVYRDLAVELANAGNQADAAKAAHAGLPHATAAGDQELTSALDRRLADDAAAHTPSSDVESTTP